MRYWIVAGVLTCNLRRWLPARANCNGCVMAEAEIAGPDGGRELGARVEQRGVVIGLEFGADEEEGLVAGGVVDLGNEDRAAKREAVDIQVQTERWWPGCREMEYGRATANPLLRMYS